MKTLILLGVTLAVLLGAGAVAVGVLTSSDTTAHVGPPAKAAEDPESPSADVPSADAPEPVDPDDAAFKPAVSKPLEDSIYPDVGDPGVDSLHYGLNLTWDPTAKKLDGVAEIALRATRTAEQLQLDLGEPLEVASVQVDGKDVEFSEDGKDLLITAKVTKDQRYAVTIAYSGTPEPTEAPTTRSDFDTIGWTTTENGAVWTMQEPYGAHTWYPVNDQPSDKALYDFTITVPSPWVGIANGTLESRDEADGTTVTKWKLDTPASSYLTTIAIGDYETQEDESASGVPISYWVPKDIEGGPKSAFRDLSAAVEGMDWLEEKLGPYPFDTLGFVMVPSESAMETQTMITMGNTPYTRSSNVVVHEMTHQWYGDQVSPTDWRDVWMNEGMTMYLEGTWEAEQSGRTVDEVMDEWALAESGMREEAGPPGDFDPATFGEGNIYYGPALMWHELHQKLGDAKFWAMVKKWPTVKPRSNATRAEYLSWIEKETGEELTAFFNAWLMGKSTPSRS